MQQFQDSSFRLHNHPHFGKYMVCQSISCRVAWTGLCTLLHKCHCPPTPIFERGSFRARAVDHGNSTRSTCRSCKVQSLQTAEHRIGLCVHQRAIKSIRFICSTHFNPTFPFRNRLLNSNKLCQKVGMKFSKNVSNAKWPRNASRKTSWWFC